jgi:hypothetical protein
MSGQQRIFRSNITRSLAAIGPACWLLTAVAPAFADVKRPEPPIELDAAAAPSSRVVQPTTPRSTQATPSTAIAGTGRSTSTSGARTAVRDQQRERERQQRELAAHVAEMQERIDRTSDQVEESLEAAGKSRWPTIAGWFGADAAQELRTKPVENPGRPAELPAASATGAAPTQASANVDRGGTFVANPGLSRPQQARPAQGDGNGTARSSASAGDEIVCRGVDTVAIAHFAWTPDDGEVSLMYFLPAKAAAGADGAGLEPGRCGYVNAALPDDRAGILLFTTAPGEESANAIREFLANPGHYWSFVVSKNANGFYEATRHARWRPAATSSGTGP